MEYTQQTITTGQGWVSGENTEYGMDAFLAKASGNAGKRELSFQNIRGRARRRGRMKVHIAIGCGTMRGDRGSRGHAHPTTGSRGR